MPFPLLFTSKERRIAELNWSQSTSSKRRIRVPWILARSRVLVLGGYSYQTVSFNRSRGTFNVVTYPFIRVFCHAARSSRSTSRTHLSVLDSCAIENHIEESVIEEEETDRFARDLFSRFSDFVFPGTACVPVRRFENRPRNLTWPRAMFGTRPADVAGDVPFSRLQSNYIRRRNGSSRGAAVRASFLPPSPPVVFLRGINL